MKKIKLTPKDCLYIDDGLTQLCAIKKRIMEEKDKVDDASALRFMEDMESAFTTHFDAIKTLLKEACEA